MNPIKSMLTALSGAVVLTSSMAMAETEMETISVSYRAPIDYALYVHNTETIAFYRLEVEQEIISFARNQSLQTMTRQALQSPIAAQNLKIAPQDKDIKTVGLSQAAE